jgi:hypothetical protein
MIWPIKKLGEINCVKKFLNNSSISFKENEIILNSEDNNIVDAFFRDKKFQIVYADFQFQKAINTTPKDENMVRRIERKRNPDDVFNDFLKNPLKKKNKYGRAAKGVILLIDSYTIPPWLESQVDIVKKLNPSYLRESGFDEIYIVCPDKNIKIYP